MTHKKRPPKIAEFLLKLFSPDNFHSTAPGDFEEVYFQLRNTDGRFRAWCWYWRQVLISLPGLIGEKIYGDMTMIMNHLKMAIRQLTKYRGYSLINISGLTVGMTCFILIALYVNDELKYDKYHENVDRIYRIVDSFNRGSGAENLATSSTPYAPVLLNEVPDIEDAVRIYPRRLLVQRDDFQAYEDDIVWTDASVFSVFTFPLLKGNPEVALVDPYSAVIDENIALKYFGNEDPLNRTLNINNSDFTITGVMKPIPDQSHFDARIFISNSTLQQIPVYREHYFESWARHEFYTYILLREGALPGGVEEKLPAILEKHGADQIKELLGAEMYSALQPLAGIHLDSHRMLEIKPPGSSTYLFIFSAAALIALIIAGINYTNISAARSIRRLREAGIRKAVGATRIQLFRQFISESFVLTICSGILSFFFVILLFPYFNELTGKTFSAVSLVTPEIFWPVLFVIVLTGILSGSYPALITARIQPAAIVKGFILSRKFPAVLKKSLIVIQYSLSITLIIGILGINKQIEFMKESKLGFNKEHVVVLPVNSQSIRDNYETVKAELTSHSSISNATLSIGVPGGIVAGDGIDFITSEGKQRHSVRMFYTDHDFISTLGISIIEGRDFDRNMATDPDAAIIVNEALVRAMQFENPIGTDFIWGEGRDDYKQGEIIGVVEDFQFVSLHNEIDPLVIMINPQNTISMAVRIESDKITGALKHIESKWTELQPDQPYEYKFLDESFDRLYRSEENLSTIVGFFTLFAVFVSSLGLFGLAAITISQRTKEIGIRKTLGSPVSSIVFMIINDFGKLILLANLLAWPAAWFVLNRWLFNFAQKVEPGFELYIFAGAFAYSIALFTICFISLKAARANPVDSLRYE
ncbi:ABC transporter permease [candidate division KSB1 bacterium]